MFSSGVIASTVTNARILVLGDSISAAYGINPESGWVNLLSNKIAQEKKPYQVINSSISGDTTANGLSRLQPLLDKYQPHIVIIELGGNDGLRGLPIDMIKLNLKKMIELCKSRHSKVLLAGIKIPPNYGRRYTEAFYQLYPELEQQHDILLIPFLLEGIGDNSAMMQADGIHPTSAAQNRILDIVWNKLKLML